MMRLFLACILTCFPFYAWAAAPIAGTTDAVYPPAAADPADPNEAEDTDDQTGALDESSLEQLWPYGNPYGPASATNFEPFKTSSSHGQNRLSQETYEPEWLNDPFGRYGSPYSPDPMNQRYDVGNLYSPGSPMHLYTRGGRTERR
ncbi:MAG: hypothetical protein HP498_02145 [Nitrospira sp.]|nr:hypothetical protein [Nitrospira sp.]